MKHPLPDNESARLSALRRYAVMDTSPESTYDDITQLASFICGTPIALMTLLDEERQWFKSRHGLEVGQTPREQAFCSYTILDHQTMIVEDATKDERTMHNPLVTSDPHIRFYAGAPLETPDGHRLGALCVIDRHPRHLSREQVAGLERLARLVMVNLELRRVSADLAAAAAEIKTLTGLLPICAYCKEVRNEEGYWERVEAFLQQHTEVTLTHGVCPKCAANVRRELDAMKNRLEG